jgi:hypothetical protein
MFFQLSCIFRVYIISESKENYLYSAYILSVVSLCQNINNCSVLNITQVINQICLFSGYDKIFASENKWGSGMCDKQII